MFFPVSDPTHLLEVQPVSILGTHNTFNNTTYRVRPLREDEKPIHSSYSNLIHSTINNSESVSQFSSKSPAPPSDGHILSAPTSSMSSASSDALAADVKKEISRILNPDNPDDIPSLTKTDPSPESINIHSLGENKASVLESVSNLNEQDVEKAIRSKPMGREAFVSPADAALRQKGFDISKVFDPSNAHDVELFGLTDDDDDSEDDDDDVDNLERQLNASLNLKDGQPVSVLDDELDTVIGESFGILGDLSTLRKKKASKTKSPKDEEVWSMEDTTDVTDFAQIVPEMALEYPFTLDIFQRRAVYRLERDENVFVAAHTSAGKTVVAEYAIALAMQRKTKVVYTSPIKTLSNQKFRDFTDRFGDVGIITGDISINPEASCLVMTTEILRSMLYKGADLIRDLSHVIFDECHWLNDSERGVVWEESIILLPSAVTIIMLSATVPNAMEFAKWVGRTKQKPVYVVSTPKRPVPLSHQLFVSGDCYPLYDSSQRRFLDANFRRASAHHKNSTKNANVRFGGGRRHSWMRVIKYLRQRMLDPAIFFCFSKKRCDEAADQLSSQDLTAGASDRNQIHLFYQSAIARLSQNDRDVPQIARHLDMLKRGIGVHHAGILPIIKEITEVLFQKGLIRILFATETFAMGVNMPARTVVFTAIRKHDNNSLRLLEPEEYIQMAGRAGRRGLDDVGTVLIFPTAADFPSEPDLKSVLTGTPKPLRSQFRLTYNMILNLLRIEELRVEDVMARSFSEAPAGRTSGTVKKLLEKGSKTLSSLQEQAIELEAFRESYQLSLRLETLSAEVSKLIQAKKSSASNHLGLGNVVLIRSEDRTFRLAVIARGLMGGGSKSGPSLKSRGLSIKGGATSSEDSVNVVSLLGGPGMKSARTPFCKPGLTTVDQQSERKQYNASGLIVDIGEVSLKNIDAISTLKIPVNERDVLPIRGKPKNAALTAIADQLRRTATDASMWADFPSVHPRRDIGLQELDAEEVWSERLMVLHMMWHQILGFMDTGAIAELPSAFKRLSKESQLEDKLAILRTGTSDESLQLMPEYRQRILVLQRLGYVDGTAVRLKGRAACEVNTCESIILTELVFEQVLQQLNAVDLAALLSSLVFTERLDESAAPSMEDMAEYAPKLVEESKHANSVIFALGEVQSECRVASSGSEYVRANVKYGFAKGVHDWASGKTFAEVCSVYDGGVAEGTIVRTIVRLCQLLRELKNVGRVIGDPDLQTRAEEAITLCRRDVIFAASLYVS